MSPVFDIEITEDGESESINLDYGNYLVQAVTDDWTGTEVALEMALPRNSEDLTWDAAEKNGEATVFNEDNHRPVEISGGCNIRFNVDGSNGSVYFIVTRCL